MAWVCRMTDNPALQLMLVTLREWLDSREVDCGDLVDPVVEWVGAGCPGLSNPLSSEQREGTMSIEMDLDTLKVALRGARLGDCVDDTDLAALRRVTSGVAALHAEIDRLTARKCSGCRSMFSVETEDV